MHSAPSVAYPVGRCALWRSLLLGQVFGSAAILLAWACLQPLGAMWCLGAGLMALALGAHVQVMRQGPEVLHWDGRDWHRRPGIETALAGMAVANDCVGDVKVVLDMQDALLLRWRTAYESDIFQPLVPSAWLWLGRERCPAHWLDVRRAVYGPHGSEG